MSKVKELAMGYHATPDEIKTDYFEWLCGLVGLDREHWTLAKTLHRTEFYWSVANDDNRASDGIRLRDIFEDESPYENYRCLQGPCSLLEMLIGLSIRIEDILSDPDSWDRTGDRFWEMISNLGIDEFTDDSYYENNGDRIVQDRINTFLSRTYKICGRGGLFPLKYPERDQRKVEIWYQMSAYLLENYNIDEENM